jgi:hypothetical protein
METISVVDQAIELYRRQRILDAANAAYALCDAARSLHHRLA